MPVFNLREFLLEDIEPLSLALSRIWFCYDQEHPHSERRLCLNYLLSCLIKADSAWVCLQDDKPVGATILSLPWCGQPAGETALCDKTDLRALQKQNSKDIAADPHCSAGSAYEQCYQQNYAILRNLAQAQESDGELILLFVDPTLQGQGLGRMLLAKSEEIARKGKAQRLYLLTDENCNYGIYPHAGYRLRLQQKMDFTPPAEGKGKWAFNTFIFDKDLSL